jgi:hypothetical protein
MTGPPRRRIRRGGSGIHEAAGSISGGLVFRFSPMAEMLTHFGVI